MNDSDIEAVELKLRLQNCLQTILELKSDLDAMPFGMSFLPEFGSLETFLSKMGEFALNENDVRRIEAATDNFLSELKALMENDGANRLDKTGLLH